jgi:hypothetical protein
VQQINHYQKVLKKQSNSKSAPSLITTTTKQQDDNDNGDLEASKSWGDRPSLMKLVCANFEDDRIVQFYEYFEDNYEGKELQVEEESRGRNNRKSPSFKKKERSAVSNKYVECKFAS